MATIGTFTRNEDGIFQGSIKTLSLNTKVRFVPSPVTDNDKAPDLRAYAGNGIEFGAAWTKRTKDGGRAYHSVKLDDPSFPAPLYASLVEPPSPAPTTWSGAADPKSRGAPPRGGALRAGDNDTQQRSLHALLTAVQRNKLYS